MILLSLLIVSTLFLPTALAEFRYVDPKCNAISGPFQTAVDEAKNAMLKAYVALGSQIDQERVYKMVDSTFGLAPNENEFDVYVSSLRGIYQQKASNLQTGVPTGLYVYCDDSVVWSTRKPDPNRPECHNQFDPRTNGAVCGADVGPQDNYDGLGNRIGGFFYALSGGGWVQLFGISNPPNLAVQPGRSYCTSNEEPEAATLKSGHAGFPVFLIFCHTAGGSYHGQ